MMTEDLYKKLLPFEENLRTAKVANYSRYISRDNGLILRDEIYNVLFKTKDTRNVGCGKCLLSMLQRIAPYYFEYKEKLNETNNVNGGQLSDKERTDQIEEQPKERATVRKLQKKTDTSDKGRKRAKNK